MGQPRSLIEALEQEERGVLVEHALASLASDVIIDLLERAARIWVFANPTDATRLRDANGVTSANGFLSYAEQASLRAVDE